MNKSNIRNMNKFAERLKELRLEKGLSQDKLAAEIHFTQGAIAKWEKGLQTPNIDVAITFAKYFNVSVDYIVGMVDY